MTRTQGSGVARTWSPSRSGFSSRCACSSVIAIPEAYVSVGPWKAVLHDLCQKHDIARVRAVLCRRPKYPGPMSAAATRFVGAWDWAGRFSVGGVLFGFAVATLLRVSGYARVRVRHDRNRRVSLRIRRPGPLVWA